MQSLEAMLTTTPLLLEAGGQTFCGISCPHAISPPLLPGLVVHRHPLQLGRAVLETSECAHVGLSTQGRGVQPGVLYSSCNAVYIQSRWAMSVLSAPSPAPGAHDIAHLHTGRGPNFAHDTCSPTAWPTTTSTAPEASGGAAWPAAVAVAPLIRVLSWNPHALARPAM